MFILKKVILLLHFFPQRRGCWPLETQTNILKAPPTHRHLSPRARDWNINVALRNERCVSIILLSS